MTVSNLFLATSKVIVIILMYTYATKLTTSKCATGSCKNLKTLFTRYQINNIPKRINVCLTELFEF